MTLPVARRAKIRPQAAAVLGAMAAPLVLSTLAACSNAAPQHAASTKSAAAASPSAPATINPSSGPIEPASALPKTCSSILSDQDLTSAFGSPQVGDTSYGKYAPLPNIGRTGRVTCGFGIAVDQFGNPGQPVLTVSVITYDQASRAISRVANEVSSAVAKGATAHQLLVNGHPATILAGAATPANTPSAPPRPSTPASPSPAASPAASPPASSGGDTELLMADGNRTFVITIPLSKLSAADAANVLTNVGALVYQHTLPPGGSATGSTTPSSGPSPKPSAS